MRKIVFIVFGIIWHVFAHANVIKVGKREKTTSIKQAIAFANVNDTILVQAGLYKEGNIIIDKRVYLKGVNRPVLDGQKKYEIISVKADGVVIEGFLLKHSGISAIDDYAGIKLYDCANVEVRNNILDDTYFGIYVQFGKNCKVIGNHLAAYLLEEQQSGNGIHCWKSNNIIIDDNEITGHRDGIYLEFVTNSTIKNNISIKNIRYGLHFMSSNANSYLSNKFINNGAGVAVMYSNDVQMFNNYFKENWGDAAYGLLLKDIRDSYIKGNHFEKNTSGIYMEAVTRVNIEHNTFNNNGWAMKIQANCMDVNVQKNNFIGNSFDVGTNGNLVLNKFNKNYWDKYEGYDINKDKIGDIPYRPVSMYSMIVEKNPPAMMLFRSFITALLDKTEKLIPSITPENLVDNFPLMKKAF
jgi:nitrous oxidase accessory protein